MYRVSLTATYAHQIIFFIATQNRNRIQNPGKQVSNISQTNIYSSTWLLFCIFSIFKKKISLHSIVLFFFLCSRFRAPAIISAWCTCLELHRYNANANNANRFEGGPVIYIKERFRSTVSYVLAKQHFFFVRTKIHNICRPQRKLTLFAS